MFYPGDLVMIVEDCDTAYFAGKIALITKNVGQDATDHASGNYYELQFGDGLRHIFTHRELVLLSEAKCIEIQRV